MDMSFLKDKAFTLLCSLMASVLISAAGVFYQGQLAQARIETQIAMLKEQQAKHELDKNTEITAHSTHIADHEQRIIRLEVNLGAIQETLTEMKGDLKVLVKGAK